VGAFVGGPSAASADQENDERGRRARAIAEDMVSPFCPATTLAYCSSPNAVDWRIEIRGWVDQGLSDEEICRRMEARVGHPLCGGRPKSWLGSGFPMLVSLAIVSVLGLVFWYFLRRRPGAASLGGGAASGSAQPTPPASAKREPKAEAIEADTRELDAKLDRELARLEDE
jgi:cytochrome c-type biogenesis protein CcmH/NrfF